MNATQKMKRLLERMAAIERMERGKLCRMGARPHYNHQTWQDGKNVVRYVPKDTMKSLQDAIDGYTRFLELAEQYADEVIKRSRTARQKVRQDSQIGKKQTNRKNSEKKGTP